jgi:hypothetical protein
MKRLTTLAVVLATGCAPILETESSEWRPQPTRQVEVDRQREPRLHVRFVGTKLDDAAVEVSATEIATCTYEEQATYERVTTVEREFETNAYPLMYGTLIAGGATCGALHLAEIGCVSPAEEEGQVEPDEFTSGEHVAVASAFLSVATVALAAWVIDGVRTIDSSSVTATEDRTLGQWKEGCGERPLPNARVILSTDFDTERTLVTNAEGVARLSLEAVDLASYQTGESFGSVNFDSTVVELDPLPDAWDVARIDRYARIAFERAERAGTVEAYMTYLRVFPEQPSAVAVEAHRRIQSRALNDATLEAVGRYITEFPDAGQRFEEVSSRYYQRVFEAVLSDYIAAWESGSRPAPDYDSLRPADRPALRDRVIAFHIERVLDIDAKGADLDDIELVWTEVEHLTELVRELGDDVPERAKVFEFRRTLIERAIRLVKVDAKGRLDADRSDIAEVTEGLMFGLEKWGKRLEAWDGERMNLIVLEFTFEAVSGNELAMLEGRREELRQAIAVAIGRSRDFLSTEEGLAIFEELSTGLVDRLRNHLPMRRLQNDWQVQSLYSPTVTASAAVDEPDSNRGERFRAAFTLVERLGKGFLIKVYPRGRYAFAIPVNDTAKQALLSGGSAYFEVTGSMPYKGRRVSGRIPKLKAYWGTR